MRENEKQKKPRVEFQNVNKRSSSKRGNGGEEIISKTIQEYCLGLKGMSFPNCKGIMKSQHNGLKMKELK